MTAHRFVARNRLRALYPPIRNTALDDLVERAEAALRSREK